MAATATKIPEHIFRRVERALYDYRANKAAVNACYIAAFHPPTVLAMLDEIERLRRERKVLVEALMPASEALADLDKSYYRVARQDPAGYVMGNVSVASLVTVIESTRKALALLDGEKSERHGERCEA